MNTLYLRIPSRHAEGWPNGSYAYAVCREDGAVVREGQARLPELAAQVLRASVVLLISAADVSLFELSFPPMSEGKLKQALPTLIEDHLMSDARECALVLGAGATGGKRLVAVSQRAWLQQLSTYFFAMGAHQVRAVPAQLCVPLADAGCSAQILQADQDTCLVLRHAEHDGIGMLLDHSLPVSEQLETLCMLAGSGPIRLAVEPAALDGVRQAVAQHAEWPSRITLVALHWAEVVQASRTVTLNLLSGLDTRDAHRVQWRQWRAALILAGLLACINIGALNYDYWNMKREADGLRRTMTQIYRSSFPKENVVLFPLEQMRKNLDLAQRSAGQASPDDFTLLLTQFAQAWSSLNGTSLPKLVSVEYKDRGLVVQVSGDLPQKDLQSALQSKGLELKKNNAEVWQVRVMK